MALVERVVLKTTRSIAAASSSRRIYVHHADKRRDEMKLVRRDFSVFFLTFEILEENGIRVGAPDVNAENHWGLQRP